MSANDNELLHTVKFFGIISTTINTIIRSMNDNQLLRYSRQIMLPQCDIEGQQKLLASKVLIVGATHDVEKNQKPNPYRALAPTKARKKIICTNIRLCSN